MSADAGLVPAVLRYLRLRGIPADRKQSGALRLGDRWVNLGEAGWPDIIGCLPGGRFLAVECKAASEKPSAVQVERLGQLAAAGALVVVARGIEDVERALMEV